MSRAKGIVTAKGTEKEARNEEFQTTFPLRVKEK
jgi:hypothetical protein